MNYFKPETFEGIVNEIITKYGKLDIFINSIGVHTKNVDFWTINSNEFDRIISINLKGVFLHIEL